MDNKFSLEEDGFQHYLGHFNEQTPTSFIHHGDIKLEDMYSFQSFTANNQVTIAEISNTGIAANNPTSNSIETNYFASTSSGAPTTSWIPSITTRVVLNNDDVPDDVENLSLCSSSQITPNNSSEAHQTQVRSSRRKKKNKCMNDDECKKFVDDLLHRVNDGKLRKGELQKLAEIYGVSRWTAQRVWGRVKESLRTGMLASVTYRRKGRCGRKPMEFDISKLVSVPLDQRCNLRILAEALGTNKSTVHRFVKRHNMSIKPGLVERLHPASSKVLDYSGPYTIQALLDNINSGMYGSLTKEVEAVVARKLQELYPSLFDPDENLSDAICNVNEEVLGLLSDDVFEVESVEATSTVPSNTELLPHDFLVNSHVSLDNSEERKVGKVKDKGTFVGVDDVLSDEDRGSTADDEESDIWREMNFALESSKDPIDQLDDKLSEEEDEGCDHSYVLKDDIGYVCRVCGVIQKAIETIFDFQYIKAARVGSYRSESRSTRKIVDTDVNLDGAKLSGHDLAVNEISPHPRHKKHMKPHQLEGFNFLLSNLIAESPGGCILAHAPGSGKTFIIISFIQSFMAQYPNARPLVVLPKGILSTWKKEFQRWQVEDIPLLDFYSVRAESRIQQKEVLKLWMEKRSILFLGYMQFSSIISDDSSYKTNAYCQEILLKLPTLLILDEGHTPRNENTDVLNSLAKVQTPRKVVLSGTLYQNHVKEVFTILNLVRPKFLRLDTSRSIKSRILSRVQFHGYKKQLKGSNVENNFFDLVEYTLQQEEDWKRKEAVIKDLREMTSKVLHYYRGDFLDDLPGLVDFTVFLSLSPQQKTEVDKLKKREKMKFRKTSLGCTVYTHPMLKQFSDSKLGNEKLPNDISKIDELVERIDIRDGVKAKFFLNMLALCESAGEKLLVFSQYLLPLKFLERLCVYKKGWIIGKEIFMIVGDTSTDQRELHMERFNNSSDARVLFGSIKACGEGISLVGASRIIILDVHLNPSVSRQAVGRAFRPGQEKKVFAYRLVAADSPEEEDHLTCLKKEQISKRWFEWDEYRGSQDFNMELVSVEDADDLFLESPCLAEDVKALHRR